MELIPSNTHFDFLGRRQLGYKVSGTLIVLSLVVLLVRGLNWGVDFRGGTLVQLAFDQDTLATSKEHWAKLIDAFEPRHPRLAEMMRRAEEDVLAYKNFPKDHWAKIHSTNPLERLNKEIKRRTNVVGIFPNEAAVTRLVGALMLEQNDEWAITRRYMTLETVAAICDTDHMDPAKIVAL